ncbi:MAG TPA: DUF5683 domain-containing protein [Bacteroidia bacterium]|nr:DUF5683 domain-containing protein [Bacteroidia bacterium]HNT80602.1 DUF5683 domain-containing protein [Bacteroidia bacterium]
MLRFAAAFLLILCITQTNAQPADSTQIKLPNKAALYSALLPGAGQIYNRKYWKLPIVYGGIGMMTYFAINNNKELERYRTAIKLRSDGDPNTIDEFADRYEDQDLFTLKDFYRRNRDVSIISGVGIYLLQIVDAYVDAHLLYFDVSDDLSLHIRPYTESNTLAVNNGIQLIFYIK